MQEGPTAVTVVVAESSVSVLVVVVVEAAAVIVDFMVRVTYFLTVYVEVTMRVELHDAAARLDLALPVGFLVLIVLMETLEFIGATLVEEESSTLLLDGEAGVELTYFVFVVVPFTTTVIVEASGVLLDVSMEMKQTRRKHTQSCIR